MSNAGSDVPRARDPGPVFAARLLDQDRHPIEGAALFVRPPLGLEPLWLQGTDRVVGLPQATPRKAKHRAVSDASGRVVLEPDPGEIVLDRNGDAALRALAAGCAALDVRARPPVAGGVRELGDLVLAPGRGLSGRVILPDGVDLPRARVYLSRAKRPEDGPALRGEQLIAGPLMHDVEDQAPLDAKGGFEFEGASLEARTLWAYGPGTTFARIDVGAGPGDQTGFLLMPALLTDRCTVEGRVLGPEGQPVGRAYVHVLYADEERAGITVRSNEDGYFRAPLTRTETFTLVGLDEDFLMGEGRTQAAPCDRDAVIRLPGCATFQVAVQNAAGNIVARSSVEVRDPTGKDRWHFGHTEIKSGTHKVALPSVPFALLVTAPGHRSTTLSLDPVSLGPEVLCTLDLDAAVVGTVTYRGSPVPGARVALQPATPAGTWGPSAWPSDYEHPFAMMSSANAPETTTDAEGHFALSSGRAGLYLVRAAADDHGPGLSTRLQIVEGAPPVELNVELTTSGAIDGRVLVRPDISPAGILVGASCGDGVVHCQHTDADGSFVLDGLSPGRWQVRRCRGTAASQLTEDSTFKTGFTPGQEVGEEPAWDCLVESGSTTRFDLDLRDDGAFVLEGKTSLLKAGIAELPLASVSIQQDGSFTIPMSSSATYALLVTGNEHRIHDHVRLQRGTTTWRYEPIAGDLALKVAPQALKIPRPPLICVGREPGGLEVLTMVSLDEKSAVTGKRFSLPSGHAVIDVAPRGKDYYQASPRPLAETFIPPNGEVEIVLGQDVPEDR